MLLDVGRHFFGVAFLKRLLDLMALLKMNRFHWHLTEDQGWRLEVKALPRLCSVGAWRRERDNSAGVTAEAATGGGASGAVAEPRRYGGYYTQKQVMAWATACEHEDV